MVYAQGKHVLVDDMVERFRANLITDGGKPGEEVNWSEIMIGQTIFKVRLC